MLLFAEPRPPVPKATGNAPNLFELFERPIEMKLASQ